MSDSRVLARPQPMVNMLTVDVEDYFHANGLAVPRSRWAEMPGRVEYTARRLLGLLAEAEVRATFFVLGWVAERYPGLVHDIVGAGHELASHGWSHRLVYEQDPTDFETDVRRTRELLEDLGGVQVLGYRAPSFSITPRSPWAPARLRAAGYRYDSSVFPVRRSRYGDPASPRQAHWILDPDDHAPGLLEVPPSAVRVCGRNIAVAGGGYFRFWPLAFTEWAIRRLNQEQLPAMMYVHPWEIDPDQPHVQTDALNSFRHYLNLDRTEGRLRRVLRNHRFAPVADVLASQLGVVPAGQPLRRPA